jgi:hemolysin activation/secretion protein
MLAVRHKQSSHLLSILSAVSLVAVCSNNFVLADSSLVSSSSAPATGTRALTVIDTEIEVKRFNVQGNTHFTGAQIDAILKPFLGSVSNLAELHNAALTLQAAYHKAGHLITRVILPNQEIEDDTVILKVIEGRLSGINVTGQHRISEESILASMPVLKVGDVLDLHNLHAELLLANENPSRRLAVNFRADKTLGDVIANVRVQEGDAHKFMASLNDTGNDNTGNLRLNLVYQNTNVMQKDHVATLQYTLAPDDLGAVSVLGGGYRIPFYRSGLMLDLVGAYSNVRTGQISQETSGALLDFTGKGTVLGAQVTRLLPTVLNVQHRLSASLYQRQYRNECSLNNNTSACGGSGEDVTTQPLAITYTMQWSLPRSQVNFNLSGSYNLSSGSNGSAADFAAVRAGADNRYLVWRMGANISQQLPLDWQIRTGIEGQWVNEPLVSGDQFGIGGADSVRGVGERVISGDKGWRANLELNAPDLGGKTGIQNLGLRPAIFVDGGSISRINPQAGDIPEQGLISAGVGLRASYGGRLSAQIDWAKIIDADNGPEKGDSRFHFNLGYVF